jgi:hypothetical protein
MTDHDLGHLSTGTKIRVRIDGCAANVHLVDNSNLRQFKAGKGGRSAHTFGLKTTAPVIIEAPRSGYWHVLIDFGGGRGKSAVDVLTGV